MIHDTPGGAQFTYRRLRGAAQGAGLSSWASVGISAGVGLAATAISDLIQHNQMNNMGKSGATAVANAMATQLNALKAAYFAERNPSCADQRAALNAFDAALIWFQSPAGCGNPQFGSAGDRCIAERVNPGAKYSYIDAIRTPIASDPRLTGCDTGTAVYLPSLETGAYADTGITSTGGSSATGASAAQIAQEAVNYGESQPPPAVAESPNYLLIGAAALAAVFIAKAL